MTDEMALCLMNNDIQKFELLEKQADERKFEILAQRKMLRTTGQYRSFRKKVLHRDNQQCVKCGDADHLEVHHIKHLAVFSHLAYEVSNGITLCSQCHKIEHGRR